MVLRIRDGALPEFKRITRHSKDSANGDCSATPPPATAGNQLIATLLGNFEKYICKNNWLVVWTPLKNLSQLGWLFPIYGKIKNVPNHQPDNLRRFFFYPPWRCYNSTYEPACKHSIPSQCSRLCFEIFSSSSLIREPGSGAPMTYRGVTACRWSYPPTWKRCELEAMAYWWIASSTGDFPVHKLLNYQNVMVGSAMICHDTVHCNLSEHVMMIHEQFSCHVDSL